MLYQLPDGRTIEMSVNDYLEFSDEELKDLVGTNYGVAINNPLYGSYITKPTKSKKKKSSSLDDAEDEDKDKTPELPDATSEEKLKDQDYIPED